MFEYITFLRLFTVSYRINMYMLNQVHIDHQNESISRSLAFISNVHKAHFTKDPYNKLHTAEPFL
jgi:hypothetical protein